MFAEDKALVYAYEYLYLFDMQTGEYLSAYEYEDEITAFSVLNSELLSYCCITADGTYYCGCVTDNSFVCTAAPVNFANSLKHSSTIAIFNNGCFMPVLENGGITELVTENKEQTPGCIAVLSYEDTHNIKIFRVKPLAQNNHELISFDNVWDYNMQCFGYGDGLVAIGPIEGEEPYFDVIDVKTLDKVGSFKESPKLETETSIVINYIHYAPDYKSIIYCDPKGDVFWYDGKTAHSLVKNETIDLDNLYNIRYSTPRYFNACTALSGSNDIVTASVDTVDKTLKIWINGKEERNISLEDKKINFFYEGEIATKRHHTLRISNRGYIILSHFEKDSDCGKILDFVVYDIASDKFRFIHDEAHGEPDRDIAISDTDPTLAVLDSDDRLRIYNIKTNALKTVIDLPIPVTSVSSFRYANGYIFINTSDNLLLIYTDTGKCVFMKVINEFGFDQIFVDKTNNRFYLNGMRYAICIEMKTWEIIAEIEDFISYIPQTNQIYADAGDKQIKVFTIPSTAELIKMAQELI